MIQEPAPVVEKKEADFIVGKIMPIHVNGSEALRKQCVDVDLNQKDLKQFIANLYATMKAADGIGLAAPQLGIDKNIFVIEIADFEDDNQMQNDNDDFTKMTFINPVILDSSEAVCDFKEGCLSVPGINEVVVRPSVIKVQFYDENLTQQKMTLSGIWARAFQHEFDHLQGKLFVDAIAQIRKQMISPKLQAMTKGKYKARYRTVKK